ncbi:nitrate- and nitrite sensing domain-containing protein [Planomonospora alba]|uniref:histidine kinase n=1 Tax=Planomonospora alba TaxID=161354 RepID=A0ABP6N802_9ACTN
MRLSNARLRTKITALLVSLAALWMFTAWVTVRDGLNMLGVTTLNTGVAEPGHRLLSELQAERRLTLLALADPDGGRREREELRAQRKRTDAAAAHLRGSSASTGVELAMSDEAERRLALLLRRLDGLAAVRQAADGGRTDRIRTAEGFTGIIDAAHFTYDALSSLDDEGIAKDVRTFIQLNRVVELTARTDAMAAGALAGGGFTDEERVLFTRTVGTQRFLLSQVEAELPEVDRGTYRKLADGEQFARLRAMEDLLAGDGQVDLERWTAASEHVQAGLWNLAITGGANLIERSTPVVAGVIIRLVLAGGLGLVAVIASVVLSVTTARALVRQLEKLRDAARELADRRLPGVVERIGHGEDVDVAVEAPPLRFGDDQIGQVGQAFNAVQRTAIKVAVEQAQLRRDIADILRNLARRTQSLVHRQLSVLDTMERREQDPQELRDLFRLDHLATRMRRYAENLLVLAGAAPGRAWRGSVPMLDVVRGALAEIEDYTRVDVLPMGEAALDGRAVGDVIHLVAELVENAASFSPPYTTVKVGGHAVAHGYAVEIEDRGLGMSEEDIAAANERIADPPELKLAGNARLGLYVVSRLAERHGIRVTFKASPYGGTTVVVLIPQELIVQPAGPQAPEPVSVPAARAEAVPAARAETAVRPAEGAVRTEGAGRHGAPAVPAPWEADPLGLGTASAPVGRGWDTAPAGPAGPAPGTAERRSGAAEPGPGTAELKESAMDTPGGASPPHRRQTPAPGTASERPPSVLPPPDTSHTPGGLPRRVPQTHLAVPLREDEPLPAPEPVEDDERSPEEIRAAFSSFQAGTLRGRSDAARLLAGGGEPADDARPSA